MADINTAETLHYILIVSTTLAAVLSLLQHKTKPIAFKVHTLPVFIFAAIHYNKTQLSENIFAGVIVLTVKDAATDHLELNLKTCSTNKNNIYNGGRYLQHLPQIN